MNTLSQKKIEGIQNAGACSVFFFAETLGVSAYLEGSVQKEGNTVRITAQLIDANTQEHIWADRYDRDLKDIFQCPG